MNPNKENNLLPMTILDGMILVAGCAISAWLLKTGDRWMDLTDVRDWLPLMTISLFGPTVAGPFLLTLQCVRGRRKPLLAGEVAWLVVAVGLMPIPFLIISELWLSNWYQTWLTWWSPWLVFACAMTAWSWHLCRGRPRHWSHRLGLAILLAQCVPAALTIVEFWS